MSQHDMVVDNADGRSVRTDMQAALQALATCSSGTVEPATKYAGMLWLDLSVSGGVLRQRNQDNTGWVPVLLSPEMRFAAADIFFGAKAAPHRFVWNNKADGTGTDIMQLYDTGVLNLTGASPALPGDVVTKSYVDAGSVPVATVIYVAMVTPPANYLKANGASLLRSTYTELFTAIGTTYGAADSTHFNVPDLRGEFIRGLDDGRGVDAGRTIGSAQASAFASHTHTASSGVNSVDHTHGVGTLAVSGGTHSHTANQPTSTIGNGFPASPSGYVFNATAPTGGTGAHTHTLAGATAVNSADHTHTITVNAAGAADTRPRNIAQLACIKYQ